MIEAIKKYFAIRSYVRRLSQDLLRRFGLKKFYPVEFVTQAVARGKFAPTFIAYAHAAFCNQIDFDAHYHQQGISSSYFDLRKTIARRYFSGRGDFDAATIIRAFRRGDFDRSEFSESGIGTSNGSF
jgi:uncharacterized protein DUF6559